MMKENTLREGAKKKSIEEHLTPPGILSAARAPAAALMGQHKPFHLCHLLIGGQILYNTFETPTAGRRTVLNWAFSECMAKVKFLCLAKS